MYKMLECFDTQVGKVLLYQDDTRQQPKATEHDAQPGDGRYILLIEDRERRNFTTRIFAVLAQAQKAWGDAVYKINPFSPTTKEPIVLKSSGVNPSHQQGSYAELQALYNTKYAVAWRDAVGAESVYNNMVFDKYSDACKLYDNVRNLLWPIKVRVK